MVRVIFYVVVAVLVLSFFGVSLQHLIENPTTQTNFAYVWSLVEEGWDDIVLFITNFWDGIWNTLF
jgi:hypothetical protein